MIIDSLENNLLHMKRIIREVYVFTNQMEIIRNLEERGRVGIDLREKRLLNEIVISLGNQLRILNNSIPEMIKGIGVYKKLDSEKQEPGKMSSKLVSIKYAPFYEKEKIFLTITDKEKKEFLENLSKSNLTINQLRKKYSVKEPIAIFGKPNIYAKISNRLFRNLSLNIISKGYFHNLNRDLRRMNSPFIISTYVSMILFTVLLSFVTSLILWIILLFFNIGLLFPFFTSLPPETSILLRAVKFFWVMLVIPTVTGLFMYIYPSSEGKNIGSKIEQELPFVAIHMSAIATSGLGPLSIFNIILKSEEYRYTITEFKKLMNLVNFQGKDIITALKDTSKTSPSAKLRELLDGLATTISSGGSMTDFLNKHAENMLFDYRLERERNTKTSETLMDIYISVVIAAPMILLMLFVIMGSTGTLGNFLGLSTSILSMLIIFMIIILNIAFLVFLKLKQPAI